MESLNPNSIICNGDESVIQGKQKILKLYKELNEMEQNFFNTIKTYNSIKAIGIKNPIVVKRTSDGLSLVRGRTRVAVARELNIPSVVAFIEGEDDPQTIREIQKL